MAKKTRSKVGNAAPSSPPPHSSLSFFFRKTRLAILMVVVIVISAMAALQNLARQEDPSLTRRFGIITVITPGADAERLESTVVEPLESALRDVEEISRIESISRYQTGLVNIELKDGVLASESEGVWSKVRDRMQSVRYPENALAPNLEVRTIAASSLLVSLRWVGDEGDYLRIVSRLAQELEQKLGSVNNTFRTKIYGSVEEEVLVEVDSGLLHRAGLQLPQLASAVQNFDTRISAGNLTHSGVEIPVEVGDNYDAIERVGRIPLKAGADGAVLRLDDVAQVGKRARTPIRSRALVHGDPGVVVSVTMEDDFRIDLWRESAQLALDDFAATLPSTVAMEVIYDQNAYTLERLGGLLLNLLMAMILVVAVVAFTMGVRSAIAVGAALPLTIMLVLIEMSWLDLPLHQMSVTGLVISLGLLIDNAIVLNEEYKHKRLEGAEPKDAVALAAQRLWRPLLGSTLTTVFAFMPIALATGGTGEFVGSIGIMVVFSVLSSLFLSLTIVLALSAYLEGSGSVDYTKHGGYSSAKLAEWYEGTLVYVFARPWRGIALGLILPVAGFISLTTLEASFFPPTDRNQFQIQLTLPRHSALETTQAQVERVREILTEYPEIRDSHWFLGEPMPRVYYNLITSFDGLPNYASGFVNTQSASDTRAILPALARRLRKEFPDTMVIATPFGQGPPVPVPIEVDIIGTDIAILKSLGEQVRRLLSNIPQITYSLTGLGSSRPKLLATPSEYKLARSNLDGRNIAQSLSQATDGLTVSQVLEGTQELPIRLRLQPLSSSGALGSVSMRDGISTVDAFAEFNLVPSTAQIQRQDGLRVNIVGAYIEPYTYPSTALNNFRSQLQASPINIPPGYQIKYSGEDAERNTSVNSLTATIPVFMILILTVVVYTMSSFRIAAIVLYVGALGLGLGFLGLRIGNYPFGFTAILGSLGLVGVSINDAIVVASGIRSNPQAIKGDTVAIRKVVMNQTRHIVSTTLTTICGFLPLILSGGDFWPPLAVAIAGGVSGATILALYSVPCLYILLFSNYTSPLERLSLRIDK